MLHSFGVCKAAPAQSSLQGPQKTHLHGLHISDPASDVKKHQTYFLQNAAKNIQSAILSSTV